MPHGRIIGGLGSPHAPSIGAAYNGGKGETPAWQPLIDGYLHREFRGRPLTGTYHIRVFMVRDLGREIDRSRVLP